MIFIIFASSSVHVAWLCVGSRSDNIFSEKKKVSLFIKTMELLKSPEGSNMVMAQGTETTSGK